MPIRTTLTAARAPLAAFAAMGVLWGSFAAALPDLKAQIGVDEARLVRHGCGRRHVNLNGTGSALHF